MELVRAEIEKEVSFEASSSEIRYVVNWVNEGGIPQNERVVAGESLCDVIAVDSKGVKLFEETKKSNISGEVITLSQSGYVGEGKVIAIIVGEEDKEETSGQSWS